jgi:hypothetical protein
MVMNFVSYKLCILLMFNVFPNVPRAHKPFPVYIFPQLPTCSLGPFKNVKEGFYSTCHVCPQTIMNMAM